MHSHKNNSLSAELKKQGIIIGSFVGIFWVLELMDLFIFHNSLNNFGIMPRSLIGLRGILFAPFLHGGLGHLIANTIPFIILGWLVMLQETSDFWIVTVITMIVGGLGIWVFAPAYSTEIQYDHIVYIRSVHLGSSILIFGYLGFLLTRGYFQKNLPSIMLSIVVFLMYGGVLWGVLPSQPGISWQGHLFGFIGGVIAARVIAKEKQHYS